MIGLGRRLWAILTPMQRRHAMLLTVAVVVMAALEVVNVSAIAPFLALVSDPTIIEQHIILAYLYDLFAFEDTRNFLIVTGLAVFFLMLLCNVWSVLTTWAQLRIVWSWNHHLSVLLLERYLNKPYTYFLSHNTANLSKNLLSEVQQITNQMLRPIIIAIGRVVVAFGIIAVLVVVNPSLAVIVAVVVGGSYGAIYMFVRKRLHVIGRDRMSANEERFTIANEALGGIKDVKVLNVEREFLKRFITPSLRFSRHQATSQAVGSVPRYVIETLAFGTVVLIVVYLIAMDRDFGNIVPVLGVYAFAGYRLMPALQQIFQGVTAFRFYSSALDSILNDVEDSSVLPLNWAQSVSTDEPMRLTKELQLVDLTFRYPESDKPAINNVTLTIPANSTIGLVGTTGSGKTTLVDVVLGLLRPQAGEIRVDGVPITEENLTAWQRNIGYVPQHIFLTDASVAENIAFGVPRDQIDMHAVRTAAKIAQIDDFVINELPHGYDTVVGERGIRLSGGQRQRIGIARALYRDPDVLVFDEATSALDQATESYVMDAIRSLRGQRTIILIAHRIATLSDCDMIFMVDHGRVVASGSYEELLRGRGEFSKVGPLVGQVH